ncbi:hypothetical protein NQZ68_003486 [Dissostichus eleginoides]|nr:hypothetical protein NQZ68_003486 [Dissostichus eleginoides]
MLGESGRLTPLGSGSSFQAVPAPAVPPTALQTPPLLIGLKDEDERDELFLHLAEGTLSAGTTEDMNLVVSAALKLSRLNEAYPHIHDSQTALSVCLNSVITKSLLCPSINVRFSFSSSSQRTKLN